MKQRKTGQVSMEFLMTYGWAIIIMLAVVAVLFLLGVFNPPTPSGCVVESGFACRGYKINTSGLTLNLIQSTSHPIGISAFACTDKDPDAPSAFTWTNFTPSLRLYSGEIQNFTNIPCYTATGANPAVGDYYRGAIYMRYIDEQTNIQHTLVGQIAYKVE
ncbi:Uncharacterised protein [uncultured archaeon]|nr:Uncharacterised protein [uncultured archaeon]